MHNYETKKRVGIVGARGYAGLELARLLLRHPRVNLEACLSADADFSLAAYLPDETNSTQVPTRSLDDLQATCAGLDTVFLATPAEASMALAPRILSGRCNVIDLSGAFRLEAKVFEEAYGIKHACPELIARAYYGLVPWAAPIANNRDGESILVSNPGCFATSVLMGLLPLLKRELVQVESIVIDSKSGTTGGGRKSAENLLFSEVDGDCLPYKVGRHQHLPEIRRYAGVWGGNLGAAMDPWFTTHLLSVRRGISTGIYARLSRGVSIRDVERAFTATYAEYPLIKHGPVSTTAGPSLSSLKRVAGTPLTLLSYAQAGDKLYLFSLIDNLLKGAAAQAVENFNVLHDNPVGLALIESEGVQ